MAIVDVMAFRMGRAASEQLTNAESDFYLAIARTISSAPCDLPTGFARTTIAVEGKGINAHPAEIYSLFLVASDTIAANAEILVVDFTNPYEAEIRGGVYVHLGRAIQTLLDKNVLPIENVDEVPIFRIFVLLPELPPLNDAFCIMVEPYIKRRQLVLVADDGSVNPAMSPSSAFNAESYKVDLARIRGTPIDLLKLKMIRRLGHFKRHSNGRHVRCVRHFFDGKFCSTEITKLLMAYISTAYEEPPLILYECNTSHWLESPVLRLAAELDLECFPIGEGLQTDVPDDLKGCPILVVTPLVDSGTTIRGIAQKLKGRVTPTQVKFFSVLSTDGPTDIFGQRQLTDAPQIICVDYALKVQQERYPPDNCRLCSLGIPESTIDSEKYLTLTTYDCWDMIKQYGLKTEDDVPNNRPSLTLVPNFPRIVDQNGPWLASKISALLDSAGEALSDSVIVCPDEKGSQVLAKYLEMVTGATVITIPRSVIRFFYKPEDDSAFYKTEDDMAGAMSKWASSRPSWYVKLTTVRTNDLIVLDEFTKSGGTWHALRQLLFAFQKNVRCYVSLANFNPNSPSDSGVPSYSLYEWQYHQSAAL